MTEEDLIQQSQAEYDSGRYSPTLLQPSELPLDTHTISPDEDQHSLELARRQLRITGRELHTLTEHILTYVTQLATYSLVCLSLSLTVLRTNVVPDIHSGFSLLL